MFKKRHLVLTSVITAMIVFIVMSFVMIKFMGNYSIPDPVTRAKGIIVSEYVNKLSEEQIKKLDDAAINAMVEVLGDPYTRYMNAEAFTEYEEDNEEDYVGIGVQVVFNFEESVIEVMSPYDNSPAQKAGILPGDKITEVDGISVSAESYENIISHIRGEGANEGDTITMKVIHKEETEPVEVSLKRERVEVQTVSYKTYDDVGYIRVAEFINRTEEEFEAALNTLKDMEVTSLIIDLRNNPGGYAHTVISMCDMLLPKGVIAYLEDNNGERQYFNSDAKEVGLPMAILINGGTASASELLAGSVQAYGLGTVVGEKSFGKAVGQSPYALTTDTALYLTNARYFTPKGNCIDGKGIIPDVEVSLSAEKLSRLNLLEKEEDDQLLAAIEVLKK